MTGCDYGCHISPQSEIKMRQSRGHAWLTIKVGKKSKPTLEKQEQQAVSKVFKYGYIAQGLEVENIITQLNKIIK